MTEAPGIKKIFFVCVGPYKSRALGIVLIFLPYMVPLAVVAILD